MHLQFHGLSGATVPGARTQRASFVVPLFPLGVKDIFIAGHISFRSDALFLQLAPEDISVKQNGWLAWGEETTLTVGLHFQYSDDHLVVASDSVRKSQATVPIGKSGSTVQMPHLAVSQQTNEKSFWTSLFNCLVNRTFFVPLYPRIGYENPSRMEKSGGF